ncbi:MAG: polyprenyl synthetase family protein [Kiritimatiellae bacterium]|nr:polyprenyl synthetase family protein [Kiritimatiellia bacterium]
MRADGTQRADGPHHGASTRRTGPYGVPASRAERERIIAAVRAHVRDRRLVPPLSMEELRAQAEAVAEQAGTAAEHADFLTVLISNEVWRDTIAGIPYERRILLLPQCLRTRARCRAQMDEFGLLCEECGQCPIGALQAEAEGLGYVVLIAEGTTVVTKLLEQGKIDAVIGVSCLSALERSFPYMAAEAIPGIAIPLWRDGCDSTAVDVDWVRDAVRLRAPGGWAGRLDLDELNTEVRGWFTPEKLEAVVGVSGSRTERIALGWVAKEGKRWRPFLTASVYKALNMTSDALPSCVRAAAIAVECFHKASLIHDDIEDNDDFRYGDMTLHQQFGVPIALNAGDLLIGEGYRLIARCDATPAQREQLLAAAVEGHCSLSIGQGEELSWTNDPDPPSSAKMLEVFRLKTAPAFEVALRLGAICAGAGEETACVLNALSRALGVAYQINDDIADFHGARDGEDGRVQGPSLLLALAYEAAEGAARERVRQAWQNAWRAGETGGDLHRLIKEFGVEEKARQLYEHYKNEAIRSLNPLGHAHLKGLLRRIVGRILE